MKNKALDPKNNAPDENQITENPYKPDSELNRLLKEAFNEMQISHYNKSNISQGDDQVEAVQLDYTVSYEGFELDGTKTITPIGTMNSLSGHLGLASTTQLGYAACYGTITLLYMDELPTHDAFSDPYEDITAEWYYPFAVESGLPELRFNARHGKFDAEKIPVSQLEQWALKWLRLG